MLLALCVDAASKSSLSDTCEGARGPNRLVGHDCPLVHAEPCCPAKASRVMSCRRVVFLCVASHTPDTAGRARRLAAPSRLSIAWSSSATTPWKNLEQSETQRGSTSSIIQCRAHLIVRAWCLWSCPEKWPSASGKAASPPVSTASTGRTQAARTQPPPFSAEMGT